MREISFYLDEEQAERLAGFARAEGRSRAAIVREAISRYRPRPEQDRKFALAGNFERVDGDPRPISSTADDADARLRRVPLPASAVVDTHARPMLWIRHELLAAELAPASSDLEATLADLADIRGRVRGPVDAVAEQAPPQAKASAPQHPRLPACRQGSLTGALIQWPGRQARSALRSAEDRAQA